VTDRPEEIARRIRAVHQLDSVIGAMRSIAASRAQQCRGRLAGIIAYAETIAEAIGQALLLLPDDGARGNDATRRALIVFGAEQGFAGAFSERVLDAAGDLSGCELFVIGTRCARIAAERGRTIAWRDAMAPHVDGVTTLVIRLAEALYDRITTWRRPRVEVIFPVWSAGAGIGVERRSLLPLDPSRFVAEPHRVPPLITLPAPLLLARLAEEYVYAELCEAAMRSFAAENEARVVTMVRAKGNIEKMLDGLRARERQVRQEAITDEVVELAGGSGLVGIV
jgi:F-type H+-transporting ATPase subunit gamma